MATRLDGSETFSNATGFKQVVEMSTKKGLFLKHGTIVDSTLIAAPLSTKNKEKKRDPETHSTKKGNQ